MEAVTEPRQIHNLALIGFMGTGKSSVGRLVARSLHFDFVDTDQMIEERVGKRVSEIFEQDGEPVFRQFEREAVDRLAQMRGVVIATGGGMPANEYNLGSLKSHALVACLWASPETIWNRVRRHSHRPLLQAPDPRQRIRELLETREMWYKQADVLMSTDLRTLPEVAQNILHQFHAARGS
jgi:shikimate kinase